MKENFLRGRVDDSVVSVPLVSVTLLDTVATASGSGEGAGSIKRNALSMRMIWSKVGRIFGSSTQHDCIIKTSSCGMSSGRFGLIC